MIRLTLLAVLEWLALSWSWSTLVRGGAAMRRAASAGVVVGPGDAIVLGVQVAAVVAAAWLLLGTVHDTVLVLRSGGSAADRGVTPRWVRRIIEQAVGTTLLLSVLAGPSGPSLAGTALAAETAEPDAPPTAAAPAQPPVVAVPGPASDDAGAAGTADPAPTPENPAPTPENPAPTPEDPASTPDDAASPPDDAGQDATSTHVVATGENLWVIARGQLVAAGIPAPTDRQVHAYWIRLIADNLAGLRSGDPDLIHPGERLVLPGPADALPADVPRSTP